MTFNEYNAAFEKALSELEESVKARDILNARIAGLRETVRVLSNLVKLSEIERTRVQRLFDMVDSATPTLADSIRAMLTRIYPQSMTAIEIRNALEESNFNFEDFSNPLSACHAALKRMDTDGEVAPLRTADGKLSYRHVIRMTPPPVYPLYSTGGKTNLSALLDILGDAGTVMPPPPPGLRNRANPADAIEETSKDVNKAKKK